MSVVGGAGKELAEKIEKKVIIKGKRFLRSWNGGGGAGL